MHRERDFAEVLDRMNVSDRSLLTVPGRFLVGSFHKRLKTIMRKFMQTARNGEQSRTVEPGRSKALERTVEYALGTVTVRSRIRFKNETKTVA